MYKYDIIPVFFPNKNTTNIIPFMLKATRLLCPPCTNELRERKNFIVVSLCFVRKEAMSFWIMTIRHHILVYPEIRKNICHSRMSNLLSMLLHEWTWISYLSSESNWIRHGSWFVTSICKIWMLFREGFQWILLVDCPQPTKVMPNRLGGSSWSLSFKLKDKSFSCWFIFVQ